MFALRAAHGGRVGAIGADGLRALPRPLRGPARFLARMARGEVEVPRGAATLSSAALFAAAGLYGAILGGHMPALAQSVTSRLGFAIADVRVSGNRETSEIDILGALGLDGWTSQIGFSAEAARERVAALPWVESASVRKVYPATVLVTVEERVPFAIWQHEGQLSLIERDGTVIGPLSGLRHADLPLVVGEGGARGAAGIVARLGKFPALAGRVKGYIRVGERRWDLRLDNGVTVKLPELGEEAAIAALAGMDREEGLLARDIVAVDMRLEDRLFVELSPEAKAAREVALKEQARNKSRTGRRT